MIFFIMKVETKIKLKKYCKYFYYGFIALCWLSAYIGVFFFAIYYGSKVSNNSEPSIHELAPRYLQNDDEVLVYQNKTAQQYINARDNYSDYLVLDNDSLQTEISVSTNILCYVEYNDIVYDNARVFIQFTYDNRYGMQYLYFKYIWLYDSNDDVIQFIFTRDGTYNVDINFNVYKIKDVIINNDILSEVYRGSTLDYTFNKLFTGNTPFVFEKNYNFNSLVSENITGDTNLIQPYKASFNDDPTDVLLDFYIVSDFVSNNRLYKGIYLQFLKPYLIRTNSGDLTVNYYGSTTQLMVYKIYYMREIPIDHDMNYDLSKFDMVAIRHSYGQQNIAVGGTNNINAMIYGTDYEFINDVYRKVYFNDVQYNSYYDFVPRPSLNDPSNGLYNPYLYRGLTLMQVLNNGYNSYSLGTLTYDLTPSDIGLSNVFVLIGSAFSGLIPIMQINVIPGITIGLLVFMPLIAGIIVLVYRAVKK